MSEFTQIEKYPAYEINRQGEVRNRIRGTLLTMQYSSAGTAYYALNHINARVHTLLSLAFGTDVAVEAGYPAPVRRKAVKESLKPVPRTRAHNGVYKRKCHDCGRPTHNYRCGACWYAIRGATLDCGLEAEL